MHAGTSAQPAIRSVKIACIFYNGIKLEGLDIDLNGFIVHVTRASIAQLFLASLKSEPLITD